MQQKCVLVIKLDYFIVNLLNIVTVTERQNSDIINFCSVIIIVPMQEIAGIKWGFFSGIFAKVDLYVFFQYTCYVFLIFLYRSQYGFLGSKIIRKAELLSHFSSKRSSGNRPEPLSNIPQLTHRSAVCL